MSPDAEVHVEPDWYPEEDREGRSRGGGLRSPERYAKYARLRRECPVAFSDALEAHATLTRYTDVTALALDTARFRSDPSVTPFIGVSLGDQIPITLHPPEHTPFRRMLNHYFRPNRMAALEPLIRRYAVEHIESLLAAGRPTWSPRSAGLCRRRPWRRCSTCPTRRDASRGHVRRLRATYRRRRGAAPHRTARSPTRT